MSRRGQPYAPLGDTYLPEFPGAGPPSASGYLYPAPPPGAHAPQAHTSTVAHAHPVPAYAPLPTGYQESSYVEGYDDESHVPLAEEKAVPADKVSIDMSYPPPRHAQFEYVSHVCLFPGKF